MESKSAAPRWRIVTPQQFKEGWIELRGMMPIHHDFILIDDRDPEHLVVLNPDYQIGK